MHKGFFRVFVRFMLLGTGLFVSHMLFVWPEISGVLFGEALWHSWLAWIINYGAFLLSIIAFDTIFSAAVSRAGAFLAIVILYALAAGLFFLAAEKQESALRYQARLSGARSLSLEQGFEPGTMHYFPVLAFAPGSANTDGTYFNSFLHNAASAELYMETAVSMEKASWLLKGGYRLKLDSLEFARITQDVELAFDKEKAFSSPLLTFELPGARADMYLNRLVRWERYHQDGLHSTLPTLEYGAFLFGVILLSLGAGWLFRARGRELDFWIKGWLGYALLVLVPVFLVDTGWRMLMSSNASPVVFSLRALVLSAAGGIVCTIAFRRASAKPGAPRKSEAYDD